jgi:hypothetical protein
VKDSLPRLASDLAAADIGSTFNFLRDDDPALDVAGGAAIRRANLDHYLEARSGAAIVGLGEAAGYAGARWSGIAFTSERTLAGWGAPYAGTHAPPKVWTEQAATIVHRVLGGLDVEEDVLLWNTVPTHPHAPGRPLTNRTPTAGERAAGVEFARRLVQLVRPAVVVAIGRIAEHDVPGARYVRHPSNGGAAGFEDGMRQITSELRAGGRLPPPSEPG